MQSVCSMQLTLVPKAYSVMSKNNLANKVQFLVLSTQCNLAVFKTFCFKPTEKRYGYLSGDKR